MGFGVWFGVECLGFMVQGLGFRLWGTGFRVWGTVGFGFRVWVPPRQHAKLLGVAHCGGHVVGVHAGGDGCHAVQDHQHEEVDVVFHGRAPAEGGGLD